MATVPTIRDTESDRAHRIHLLSDGSRREFGLINGDWPSIGDGEGAFGVCKPQLIGYSVRAESTFLYPVAEIMIGNVKTHVEC